MTQPAQPGLSPIDAATLAINQRMNKFDGHEQVWLFGYGSLIYKADFPYLERRPARIEGWTRGSWSCFSANGAAAPAHHAGRAAARGKAANCMYGGGSCRTSALSLRHTGVLAFWRSDAERSDAEN